MNDIWKGQSANYITEPEQPKAQIIFKIEEVLTTHIQGLIANYIRWSIYTTSQQSWIP